MILLSSVKYVTNGTIVHCHTTDYFFIIHLGHLHLLCPKYTRVIIQIKVIESQRNYMHTMLTLVSWHVQIFTDQISRTRKQNLVKWHIRIAMLFMECYPDRKMTCAGAGAITVFRSNSKFEQNLKFFGLKYTQLITTKFGTCHDSVTVVTFAKFHCDRPNMLCTRALQNFIEFRIGSRYR